MTGGEGEACANAILMNIESRLEYQTRLLMMEE